MTVAARSSARTFDSAPRKRPRGVRSASTITASGTARTLFDDASPVETQPPRRRAEGRDPIIAVEEQRAARRDAVGLDAGGGIVATPGVEERAQLFPVALLAVHVAGNGHGADAGEALRQRHLVVIFGKADP